MDETTAKLLVAWRDLAIARGRLLACYRLGRGAGDRRAGAAIDVIEDATRRLRELGDDPGGAGTDLLDLAQEVARLRRESGSLRGTVDAIRRAVGLLEGASEEEVQAEVERQVEPQARRP